MDVNRRLGFGLTAVFFFLPFLSRAENYVLFAAPGVQAPRYEEVVRSLAVGDSIEFSNGKRFKITEIVGQGSTTRVLSVAELPGKVMRIPLKSGLWDRTTPYTHFIDNYLTGAAELTRLGGPVPKIFPQESLSHEYAIAEKLEIQFNYGQWLEGKIKLPAEREAQVRSDFLKFARKTWAFAIVGDMYPEQIAYTAQGWFFVDFDNRHKLAQDVHSGTVFTMGYDEAMAERYFVQNRQIVLKIDKLPTPQGLHREIIEAIESERVTQGMKVAPSLFRQCWNWLTKPFKPLPGK